MLAPKPDVLGADAADWPPAREAREALERLVNDRTVSLRFEGRRRDRYGRALAQVFVSDDGGDVWLQERLLLEGHARAYTLPGNTACLGALLEAEAQARAGARGLWRRDMDRVRSANEVDELLKAVGRFVLVEGRVAAVARAGATVYINFGADWRHDFTASLAAATVDRSSGGRARVDALRGKTIRVRGWIERRNGPFIDIHDAALLERVDG